MAKKERPQNARDAVEAGDLWRNAGGTPDRGIQTAEDIQRPRDAESSMNVVPGATTTGVTGSQSGRMLHGVAPDDLPADALGEEGDEEK